MATTRILSTLAAAALVSAVAAVPAGADNPGFVYCVLKPSCVGGQEYDLQSALDDAWSDNAPSRIELGPGVYSSCGGAGLS
jgi:hypothetical protein